MVARTGWRLTPEPWLREVLGVDSARLELVAGGAPLGEAMAPGPAFVGVKLPAGEVAALREVVGAGFRPVGTLVVLGGELASLPAPAPGLPLPRLAGPEDLGWLQGLLPDAFPDARFERDPDLDPETVRELRRRWASQCLGGDWPVRCWVVEDDEGPAGFLSVRVDGAPVARVDLLVIEARARGRGLGPHLLCAAAASLTATSAASPTATSAASLTATSAASPTATSAASPTATSAASPTPRYTELHYPTQLANAGAVRMCERLGLRFREALHVLHAHHPGPGDAP